MDSEYKTESGESKGTEVSWSKRTKSSDGSEVRIDVEKIENGFLKTTCTEGKNSNGEYEYKTIKEFSETNPFETEEKEEMSLVDKLADYLKNK